jgi:hypothetical protein|tara:strand:+ start:7179 stop:7520 length:342 start_codon:yes stop_codon:yes gene_type:complete
MRHIKECRLCGDDFSLRCPKKRRVGGKINECPDCVEEHGLEIKSRVRAFTTGDGKMAAMQILRFDNEDEADAYGKTWEANRGWNNQRRGGLNNVKFSKVGENIGNSNHKGKAS